jgi:hypothetical protein
MFMDGLDFHGPWAIGHFLFFALMVAAVAWPIGRILARIGYSPFWAVLTFIPVANLVAVWVLAVSPWPKEPQAK